ncbi:MAG: hypothetical protein ACK4TI_05855, partial [Nitrososphaerales archaeon]
ERYPIDVLREITGGSTSELAKVLYAIQKATGETYEGIPDDVREELENIDFSHLQQEDISNIYDDVNLQLSERGYRTYPAQLQPTAPPKPEVTHTGQVPSLVPPPLETPPPRKVSQGESSPETPPGQTQTQHTTPSQPPSSHTGIPEDFLQGVDADELGHYVQTKQKEEEKQSLLKRVLGAIGRIPEFFGFGKEEKEDEKTEVSPTTVQVPDLSKLSAKQLLDYRAQALNEAYNDVVNALRAQPVKTPDFAEFMKVLGTGLGTFMQGLPGGATAGQTISAVAPLTTTSYERERERQAEDVARALERYKAAESAYGTALERAKFDEEVRQATE